MTITMNDKAIMEAIMDYLEFIMEGDYEHGYYIHPNCDKIIKVDLDEEGEAIPNTEKDVTSEIMTEMYLLRSL